MYIYFVYINANTCMYIFKKICYVYILNIYNIKYNYINVYTCNYFQNIYCMCVYLYIHNKYTQYRLIYYVNKNFYFGSN